MFNEFILTAKELFETVKIVKPLASRQKSSEMYLLALGLKSKGKCEEET
jgi:23S rRNA U2552 (ribose-2'-O)-methylase RlmE/FtsJ